MKSLRPAARRAFPALLLAAALASFAQAQPLRPDDARARGAMAMMHGDPAPCAMSGPLPPPHGPGAPGSAAVAQPPLPPWLHGVTLTETQQDKLFAVQHAAAPALRDAMRAARKAREALHTLATAADYDDIRARMLAESEAKAMAELGYQQVRIEHAIYALLTPEQRQQVDVSRRVAPGR
jgi:Spy/CpxP family protein refolding chaperone